MVDDRSRTIYPDGNLDLFYMDQVDRSDVLMGCIDVKSPRVKEITFKTGD
ncbi:MAG: hypothetical protein METHP_01117 [Methanoregula sp. SKADARSKE-2]|nr:MAG: hypothetical protein METHP_01117 [Methanoregula sp. SKADARSKE-2]